MSSTRSTRGAFPIPMRGNEGELDLLFPSGDLGDAGFPIPMRGNEARTQETMPRILAQVSDPHEG